MVQVLAFIYFVRSDSSQSLNYKARLFLSFDKKKIGLWMILLKNVDIR